MSHSPATDSDKNQVKSSRSFRLIAPPHTPFDQNGRLNLDPIEAQARQMVESEVFGTFVAGSTGESLSLTVTEHKELIHRWIEVSRPTPLKVIVHVGRTCQLESIALADYCATCGVDAVAVAAPSYFKPATIDDLIEYCRPIAEAVSGVPFYFYDIPRLTNVVLPMPELLAHGKSRISNLAGLKFTNTDLVQLQECMASADGAFDILFGCDNLLLPAYALGVTGAIGTTYNLIAPVYLKMIRAFDEGNYETARRLQLVSVRMIRRFEQHDFLAASKSAMKQVGIDCGPVRAPLRNLTSEEEAKLHQDLTVIMRAEP